VEASLGKTAKNVHFWCRIQSELKLKQLDRFGKVSYTFVKL